MSSTPTCCAPARPRLPSKPSFTPSCRIRTSITRMPTPCSRCPMRRRARSAFATSTASGSYERMIDLVSLAEEYLQKNKAWHFSFSSAQPSAARREEIASLRRSIAAEAGVPVILKTNENPKFIGFARHPDAGRLSQKGPATPDHVIRTKPLPMLGRDVTGYAKQYRDYFERQAPHAKDKKTMLDAAPRMVLDPQLGFAAAGRTARDAAIVEDLYDHTIDVILRAEALGGWRAVSERDLFDIEYWDLEQAKLRKAGSPPLFTGEVVVVTGAASGIGKACADSFLKRGAAVVGLDR